MVHLIFALVGFACGGLAMFIALDAKRKRVQEMQRQQEKQIRENKEQLETIQARENKFDGEMQRQQTQFSQAVAGLNTARKDFENQVITYREVTDENVILKRDLRNLAINLKKLDLDRELHNRSQVMLDKKVDELCRRYLKESVKWISNSLNANNFANCKQRLQDVIERCRDIGFQITEEDEASYIADLRVAFEKEVRAAFEREEQARIKAQIREEQKLEREIQREQERIARERAVLEAALATALASAADQHSAEIESLKTRLAEAEAKQRAIAQAQLTKAGFIYVISNIGSFGEGVFKVGMTRRLEPQERVRELGDASVPFPFDIHMMISCQNAPALENALHRALVKQQVNKTNPKKEFFRSNIETIVKVVRENHGEVEYLADPEALQYRQSLAMSDEDLEFIEHVFEDLEGDEESFDEETSQPSLPSDQPDKLVQSCESGKASV